MTDGSSVGGVNTTKGDVGLDRSETNVHQSSTTNSSTDDHSQTHTTTTDNSSRVTNVNHSSSHHDARKYKHSTIQIGGVAVPNFTLALVALATIVAIVALVALVLYGPGRPTSAADPGGASRPSVPTVEAPTVPAAVDGMVPIPAGRVVPDGGAAALTVDRGFLIDETEVTVFAFRRFAEERPEWAATWPVSAHGAADNMPVTSVTWDAATAYCSARGSRLPTVGEWQYAARGGVSTPYWWGTTFDAARAHFGGGGPLPVGGATRRNGYQVYDTVGNVWEWTASEVAGGRRAVVGGGWEVPAGSEAEAFHRVDAVQWIPPSSTASDLGFRCVKD